MNDVAVDLEAMTRLQELGNLCSRAGVQIQEYLDAAIDLTGADKGNIQLLEVRSGPLKMAAQRRFDQAFLDFFAEVKWEEPSACAAAIRQAGRVVVEDVSRSDIFRGQESLQVLLRAGVRAVQSAPLISSAGNLLGIISTHFARPHRFTERELLLIDLLARQAADFLERKQAEEIRALENDGLIPVIAMSAVLSEADRGHIFAAGFSAYVPKPFTSNDLLDAIRSVLADSAGHLGNHGL